MGSVSVAVAIGGRYNITNTSLLPSFLLQNYKNRKQMNRTQKHLYHTSNELKSIPQKLFSFRIESMLRMNTLENKAQCDSSAPKPNR